MEEILGTVTHCKQSQTGDQIILGMRLFLFQNSEFQLVLGTLCTNMLVFKVSLKIIVHDTSEGQNNKRRVYICNVELLVLSYWYIQIYDIHT